MGVDHSNMVLPHRVPHIRPSASTTPTPHLHSHTSTCPQHVPTRHDKSTHCRHMPLSASSSSDPGDPFGLLQHYCRLPGCRDIPSHVHHHHTSPPLPHLYLSRLTTTKLLIGWTCRFQRRLAPVVYMGLDHSNMVLPHRVPQIRPPASHTTTSHSTSSPLHVARRDFKSTERIDMDFSGSC